MSIKKILWCTTFTSAVLINTPGTSSSLMDINAQNDIVAPKMTVRLNLKGVGEGLSDYYCINVGGASVSKDRQGNFLEFVDQRGYSYFYQPSRTPVTYRSTPLGDPKLETQRLRQQAVINAWGTISYTKRIVGNRLANIESLDTKHLQRWNYQRPVKLYALDNNDYNNAYFQSEYGGGGSIHFLPLKQDDRLIGTTANDYDIVSHETGHNISYILRPGRNLSRPQTGAIDESLGDWIAFSSALTLSPIRDKFLKETGGNLHKSSFLSETAESLGQALGLGTHGIRNALNTLCLGDTDCEVHELSRIFTGAL